MFASLATDNGLIGQNIVPPVPARLCQAKLAHQDSGRSQETDVIHVAQLFVDSHYIRLGSTPDTTLQISGIAAKIQAKDRF